MKINRYLNFDTLELDRGAQPLQNYPNEGVELKELLSV